GAEVGAEARGVSHMLKVVIGAVVVGVVLGLIVYGLVAGLEEVFVDADGAFKSGRRRGPFVVPLLLGAGMGWVGMKLLDRFSGLAGSVLVFALSALGAAAAMGVMALGSGSFERVTTQQSLVLMG